MSRTYTLGLSPTENPGNGSERERPSGYGPFRYQFSAGRFRKKGGFSPRQQAVYRPLVDSAWLEVADDVTDRLAKENWYRETLRAELGVYTSKQLNKTGDFEKACAAFEIISGKDIYWQLRVAAGPIERARLELDRLMKANDVEESYLNGIAQQMFGTSHASNCDAGQLNKIIVALKQHFGS